MGTAPLSTHQLPENNPQLMARHHHAGGTCSLLFLLLLDGGLIVPALCPEPSMAFLPFCHPSCCHFSLQKAKAQTPGLADELRTIQLDRDGAKTIPTGHAQIFSERLLPPMQASGSWRVQGTGERAKKRETRSAVGGRKHSLCCLHNLAAEPEGQEVRLSATPPHNTWHKGGTP